MGIRAFRWQAAAFLGLLVGVAGCEDRARPEFGGLGNGIGPNPLILSPGPLDTVHRGSTFTISVSVEDEDGVDSAWITLSDSALAQLRFSGSGQDLVFASYTPFLPNAFVGDTIVIRVQGIDLWGDSGAVVERRLFVQ